MGWVPVFGKVCPPTVIVMMEEHMHMGADLPCPLIVKLVCQEPWAEVMLEP